MQFTIHTSATPGSNSFSLYGASYAPAFIPLPGATSIMDRGPWDFARLMDYIGANRRDTELGLISDHIHCGGVGRIAMAVDGKETVVYRVTGGYTRGFRFEVDEEAELRVYDYLMPKED